MSEPPVSSLVSVVIPCRNEARFIDACLTSVLASDFPRDRLEVLVVDGMSNDGTRAIVARHVAAGSGIRMLDNPARTAPAAMNIGIRAATGGIIVRIDAHCLYPTDYIRLLVTSLESSGADNVGGVCATRPANGSAKARAIARAMSHPFGVGNSHFRIGTTEPRWVDTVPFGCYRREVFDRIGLFDEDLVRNQDDELNARLITRGGRILLVPGIVSEYFARESLAKVWRTYWQYGYFKPLVARKLRRVMTLRQVVPAVFVLSAIGGLLLTAAAPAYWEAFLLPLMAYAAADLFIAVQAVTKDGPCAACWLAVVFPTLHLAYGLGFLRGVVEFVIAGRSAPQRVRAVPSSR